MTRRWLIPIAAGCLALVVLVLGTVTWLVLFPDPDPPGRSDAIVMLGGPDLKPRVAALDHLMALGAAPTAVVSTGGAHSRGKPSECQRSYPVICFQPDPFTTKGEVDFVREVAQQRGWRSVQVLTFRPHVSRTQWLFGKCTDLDVRVIEVDSPLRPRTSFTTSVAGSRRWSDRSADRLTRWWRGWSEPGGASFPR